MSLTRAQFNMIKGKSYLLADMLALTDGSFGDSIYVSGRTEHGDGYEGMFIYKEGDYSTEVSADTLSGIYAKHASYATSEGCWVRYFNGVCSPLWFGSNTTPGVTDMSEALQAALESPAEAIDGEGQTYAHMSTLTYSTSKTLKNIKLKYTGLAVKVANHITADDIKADNSCSFDGNDLALRVIWCDAASRMKLKGCEIKNAYSDGTLTLTSTDAWTCGVIVTGDSQEVDIDDCIIRDIHAYWDDVDLEVDTSVARGILFVVSGDVPTQMSITNNRIYGVTGSSGIGVHLLSTDEGTYFSAMDFVVEDNRVYGVTNRAYKIQASRGVFKGNSHYLGGDYLADFFSDHGLSAISDFFNATANLSLIKTTSVTAISNHLVAPGYFANVILDSCGSTSVTNNKCVNDNNSASTQYGIALTNSVGCVVQGNTTQSGDYGVWILGSLASYNVVDGNIFSEPEVTGVLCDNNTFSNDVTNNKIFTSTATPVAGIRASSSNYNTISGNSTLNSGVPVVNVNGTSVGNVISRNSTSYDNTGSRISVDDTTIYDDNIFEDNTRRSAHRQVTSWPITYGNYDVGDIVTVLTGTPGEYLYYICSSGGVYGTSSPVFVKTSLIEVA